MTLNANNKDGEKYKAFIEGKTIQQHTEMVRAIVARLVDSINIDKHKALIDGFKAITNENLKDLQEYWVKEETKLLKNDSKDEEYKKFIEERKVALAKKKQEEIINEIVKDPGLFTELLSAINKQFENNK